MCLCTSVGMARDVERHNDANVLAMEFMTSGWDLAFKLSISGWRQILKRKLLRRINMLDE